MAASVPAELAPRLSALKGARRKLAAATPKRLHARDERNDFVVEKYSLEVRALLKRCATLAAHAHAVGVEAGLAVRICENALLALARTMSEWGGSVEEDGCTVPASASTAPLPPWRGCSASCCARRLREARPRR